jgi:hypothetical protein
MKVRSLLLPGVQDPSNQCLIQLNSSSTLASMPLASQWAAGLEVNPAGATTCHGGHPEAHAGGWDYRHAGGVMELAATVNRMRHAGFAAGG